MAKKGSLFPQLDSRPADQIHSKAVSTCIRARVHVREIFGSPVIDMGCPHVHVSVPMSVKVKVKVSGSI